MTEIPPHPQFAAHAPTSGDTFDIRRSRWLNAFAKFEIAIGKCLIHFDCDQDARKVPLGARLSTLASLPPGAKLPRERAEKLSQLAKSCERTLATRASLAHGTMTLGRKDGQAAALFQNAADAAHDLPVYLVMTIEDFDRSSRELQSRTSKLDAFLSTPSSPPPPKPAVKAGP